MDSILTKIKDLTNKIKLTEKSLKVCRHRCFPKDEENEESSEFKNLMKDLNNFEAELETASKTKELISQLLNLPKELH